MIIDLKPYPSVKDSGVEWLGEVPEHWEVRRLRTTVNGCTNGVWGNDPDGSRDLVCVRVADFDRSKLSVDLNGRTIRAIASSERRGRLLKRGDLLLEKSGGGDLQPVGAVVMYDYDLTAVCSNFVARMPVSQGSNAKFLTYLHASLYAKRLNVRSIKQTTGIQNLDSYSYLSEHVSLPPLTEQTAIVRFLDHADQPIRRYIRAKQKLIALLEEQKQAVIHHAVTGQIDVRTGQPYAAYKPSGMAWLGDVPRHWDVEPAKWYFREADDRSETGSEELLSVSHITGVTPRSEKNVTMFKAESNVGYKLCRPGDVVINTMWAWMGALGIARQTGIVSPSYAVYRPHSSSRLQGDYTDLLLRTRAYKSEYVCRSTGIRSSRLRLYPEDFLRIKLLGPPHEEQRRIVEFVNSRSAMANSSIHRTRDKITLLKEYRTRLIADVVTGKLDVRKAVACLRDETETSQAMDRPDAHLLSTRT